MSNRTAMKITMHHAQRRCLRLLGAGLCFAGWLMDAASVRAEAPAAEIVVSIRYLQQTGASHAHLYLFRADGTLLLQLTADERAQSRDPVFAPDGETSG